MLLNQSKVIHDWVDELIDEPLDFTWDYLFIGYAKLLALAHDKMDVHELRDLEATLPLRAEFSEAALIIDQVVSFRCYEILFEEVGQWKDVYLLKLMLVLHDLEFFIRPKLLRMNWVMGRATREENCYS